MNIVLLERDIIRIIITQPSRQKKEPSLITSDQRGLSLSKNPCFQEAKTGILPQIFEKASKIREKEALFQLQFASFFRFMAAYLSLTHLVTAAKPL